MRKRWAMQGVSGGASSFLHEAMAVMEDVRPGVLAAETPAWQGTASQSYFRELCELLQLERRAQDELSEAMERTAAFEAAHAVVAAQR